MGFIRKSNKKRIKEVMKMPTINAVCPNDKGELKYYDGLIGYEAFYCPICGFFTDHNKTGQDDFFIGK